MAIDPQLQQYYVRLAERFADRALPADPSGRRALFAEIAALSVTPDSPVVEHADITISLSDRALAARLYRPIDVISPRLIVYFHGGGWVIGSRETHHSVAALMAQDTGCAVASVEYRLAPEHPFPAPCDDALDALVWLAEHRLRLGLATDFLAVAGDSAGGHLAAQAAAAANARLPGLVQAQWLIYPVASPRFATESYRAFAEGPGLTRAETTWYWKQFLGAASFADIEAGGTDDVRIDLLAAPPAHVPPSSVVMVAAHDVLRDDGVAYADYLVRHGAAVISIEASGMTHGFARLQPDVPRAREWMRRGAQSFLGLLD